jgi:hypothetical protein
VTSTKRALRLNAAFVGRQLLPSVVAARMAFSSILVDEWHAFGCGYPSQHPVGVPV